MNVLQALQARTWSLRFTIISVLIVTVMLTAGVIITVSYVNSRDTLLASSQVSLNQVTQIINEYSEKFLMPVADATRFMVQMHNTQTQNVISLDTIEATYFSLLHTYPGLASLDYGDHNGQFLMVKRMSDGSLATKKITTNHGNINSVWYQRKPHAALSDIDTVQVINDDVYDPRQRPWYQGAIQKQAIFWTDVYLFATDQQPAITAAIAIRDGKGRVQGVTSASMTLSNLSQFLKTVDLGQGQVFIVNQQQQVIAASHLNKSLPTLAELGDPLLAKLSTDMQFRQALQHLQQRHFQLDYAGENYLGTIAPLNYLQHNHWLIGAYLPEAQLLGDIKKGQFKAMLLSLLCLIFALLLTWLIARRIVQPLQMLTLEARRMQQLEFDFEVDNQSIFEELSEALQAFKVMKMRLRALSRYAPTQLVGELMETKVEPQLGGRVEELTLLFSDIKDFSNYAEQCDAQQIAQVLGRYLHTLTDHLRAHQGTVDKYMGDGIMAFWNAPKALPDHPVYAVTAALSCLEAIEKMADKRLYTRFGIHTARVMVGNFGSLERFNYTAVGDGVNLASRLESVNRHYGTQLIISESTYNCVKSKFTCRCLDKIAVKGKQKPCLIYEVMGHQGTVDKLGLQLIEQYELGLTAYFAQQFSQAISYFNQALAILPDDKATQLLLKRAKTFAQTPPAVDWNGTFTLDSK